MSGSAPPAVPLLALRHGPTAWNEAGRIQGRADIPLDAAGRAAVRAWRSPVVLAGHDWIASPLQRAVETAWLLGAPAVATDSRVIEMDWGRWEGRRLDCLRAEEGAAMAANEARGLDFRPPGGESPREVRDRLATWLSARAALGRPTVLVTHKGVLQALMSAATGWDMIGKRPARADWGLLHCFRLRPDGTPVAERLEVAP